MQDLVRTRVGTTMTLSAAEREWIEREGRSARALEAAQRRDAQRFSRRRPTQRVSTRVDERGAHTVSAPR